MDEQRPKVLFFDVGGTVFDWHATVRGAVADLAADRGIGLEAPKFANAWRRRMFEILDEVRTGKRAWLGADAMQRLSLDDVAGRHPDLALGEAEKDGLVHCWHALQPWPDATDAIARLRTRYTVVVLTVLSWAGVVASSKRAGIDWDGILACEVLGFYKPDPSAYRAALRIAAVEPAEAMLVAAHVDDDLRPAHAEGIAGAFVARPLEHGRENGADRGPFPDMAVNATDLADLADQLLD